MATTKSKPFRAFVEGETISDGRKITAEMIDECAATFNLETYTPRINIEHISGFSPEPPFNGYGDVVALEAKTDAFTIAGKTEQRRALYATVNGNDQLVTLAKADQKPFPSVELTPSYAGSGKFGVIGLAFTDTPASVGTQRLQFSSRAPGTVFASAADAVAIEFEAAPVTADSVIAGFFKTLTDKFTGKPAEQPATPPVTPPASTPPTPANDNAFDPAAFSREVGVAVGQSIAAAMKPMSDAHAALEARFTKLEGDLANTERPGFSRAPASGGGSDAETDC